MSFYHNWQRLFSYEYRVKTAPEQAIIEELQALRTELRALREDQKEPQFNEREQYIYDAFVKFAQHEEWMKSKGY